jgi:thiamine biosynthesis lipoprotein
MNITFRAMGTIVEAWCPPEGEPALEDLFRRVEGVCSRFRADSELSRINDIGTRASHALSPLMAEVMTAADHARNLTDGLVDVGVGSAVIDWGYDRTYSQLSGRDQAPPPMGMPSWSLSEGRIHKEKGTRFDLGGIAKGWTCDKAVEAGLCGVASAGGDLRSADPQTIVTVVDPWGSDAVKIEVGVGALATSSTTRRRWSVDGREVTHLMDPRTMTPVVSPILSATVVASTGVEAEAGAKAVLLLGEEGLAWADEQPWIRSAIVVWHEGSVFATSGLEQVA